MEEKKFYMVWNPNGGAPRVRHSSKTEARNEATRLALANPRQQFYVLSAFEMYQTNRPVQRTVLADPAIASAPSHDQCSEIPW